MKKLIVIAFLIALGERYISSLPLECGQQQLEEKMDDITQMPQSKWRVLLDGFHHFDKLLIGLVRRFKNIDCS